MSRINNSLKVVVGLGRTGLSCVRYLLNQGVANLVVVDSRLDPPGLKELQQDFPMIQTYLGGFAEEILMQADELIISPGVSLAEKAITKCLAKGIKVTGDVELFVQAAKKPILAITGSNGKSTVASLVGEMIKASGKKVGVGGNFGVPALELLGKDVDFYVLELSSFQLETVSSLKAKVAVILNIFPDHMDRYRNLSHYLATKQRVYSGCSIAIVNRDDKSIYADIKLPSKVIGFGSGKPRSGDFGIIDGYLAYGEEKLLPISRLQIKGLHNVKNSLAALALGLAIELPFSVMVPALKNFSGLPHRLQWLRKINGVDWYNDSKGTNVGATKSLITGLGSEIDGKIILIAGGVGKGADFSLLRDVVKKYVRTLVLIGKDADLIEKSLAGSSKILKVTSLKDAVERSFAESLSGDVVLFSPACASFDMFNNFEHRGEIFILEVNKLRAKS